MQLGRAAPNPWFCVSQRQAAVQAGRPLSFGRPSRGTGRVPTVAVHRGRQRAFRAGFRSDIVSPTSRGNARRIAWIATDPGPL